MRKMMEELFYGNIRPNEHSLHKSLNLSEAIQIHSESEDKLTELLEGKEKKLFIELLNSQGIIEGSLAVENFLKRLPIGSENRTGNYERRGQLSA